MSIATEITRLQTAKNNIKSSIEGKGVTVPGGTSISEYSNYIDLISTSSTGSTYNYLTGALTLTNGGICFNTYTEDDARWGLTLNFKVSSLGTTLVQNYYSSAYQWKVTVNDSGYITLTGANGYSVSWDDWTIATDTWYILNMYGYGMNASNSVFYASIDNASYVSATSANKLVCATQNTRSLIIGGDAVSLRDNIIIKGTPLNPSSTQNTLIFNIAEASVGNTINKSYTFTNNNSTGTYVLTSANAVAQGTSTEGQVLYLPFRGSTVDLSQYSSLVCPREEIGTPLLLKVSSSSYYYSVPETTEEGTHYSYTIINADTNEAGNVSDYIRVNTSDSLSWEIAAIASGFRGTMTVTEESDTDSSVSTTYDTFEIFTY